MSSQPGGRCKNEIPRMGGINKTSSLSLAYYKQSESKLLRIERKQRLALRLISQWASLAEHEAINVSSISWLKNSHKHPCDLHTSSEQRVIKWIKEDQWMNYKKRLSSFWRAIVVIGQSGVPISECSWYLSWMQQLHIILLADNFHRLWDQSKSTKIWTKDIEF